MRPFTLSASVIAIILVVVTTKAFVERHSDDPKVRSRPADHVLERPTKSVINLAEPGFTPAKTVARL